MVVQGNMEIQMQEKYNFTHMQADYDIVSKVRKTDNPIKPLTALNVSFSF